MDTPRITIGLTTYQSARFLDASLRSLLAQTEREFRLVISDDGSSDGTVELCRNWAGRDARIVFHRQERTLGPRRNFEFLLGGCDSDFFMWASHDDLWSPNFLQSCLARLEANPDAGFAIPRWVVESWTIPFLRRRFLPSMSFIEDPDPVRRMLAFTALPFSSFKDNLTYGVWRRPALARVIADLDGKTRYFSIGCVANEYALMLFRGCVEPAAQLRKRYRYVPPGSLFEPLFSVLSRLKRGGRTADKYPRYSHEDYLHDLAAVLALAGLDGPTLALALERTHPAVRERHVGQG